MANPVHTWIHFIKELGLPPFIRKEQHDEIRLTVEEIQDNCITSVQNEDETLSIEIREGQAIINSNTAGVENELVLSLVQSVDWNDPVLSYTPIKLFINNGRITKTETGDAVTIDTAEACNP